jgi:hypothetical protein
MTHQQHTHDTISKQEIKREVEKLLNFNIDRHTVNVTEDHSGLKLVTVKVSADRNQEAVTYRVQVCPICGEAQPATLQTFKKTQPQITENLLKKLRREQAEDYIENGERPASEDLIKSRAENKLVGWDNNKCEARHPPRA